MATVDLDIGGILQPTNVTVDQGDYDGDTLLNARALSPNTTLNITNSADTNDVLELQQTLTLGVLSTSTVNLEENANVQLTGLAGVNVGSTFNYNLANGSTLEMTSNFLSLGLGNTINIDLGDTGTSTFIYDPTGINVEVSDYPNISGITAGDQIQVVGAASGEYSSGDLIFRNEAGVIIGRFNADGLDPSQVQFEGGTMTYACYLKGTHIATPDGEVRIEDLKAGDKVLTASGGVATVKWLGHRMLHKSRIPAKNAIRAFPILFKKDSIDENVPHRDLLLSPGHHVYFDGALIPAMLLVNGQTVVQQFDMKAFEYFHVELEQFDILLAEGVPAESYVDTGNRAMFQNARTVAMLPDFGPAEGRPAIDGIQVVRSGPVVEAVRKRLLKRVESLTRAVRIADPDLRVEVNGQQIRPEPADQRDGVLRFALPAGADLGDLHIRSRSAVVRETSAHARRDLRQVGVGLARIAIEDEAGRRDIDLMDSGLRGLHAPQDVYGRAMRWTDGDAVIPVQCHRLRGQAVLELHVLRTYSYWDDAQALRRAA